MVNRPQPMERAATEMRAATKALLHISALFDAIAAAAEIHPPRLDSQSLAEIGCELAIAYSERFSGEAEWFEGAIQG
ncbi:hypothetical protein [Pandoraea apista]|uniref:hypothetical protein n=1 Tax=Pandoraea apista TaxID=93218 RepID=UPI000F622034|nr:hypothetical protein [Pandoraea apista]RRJ34365.1 hypothetical protein EIB05_03730 [Pandoraea apista]RRJ81490.1 hypothetical protein EIL82_03795 [Pandoraea apista]RSD08225.1 hypothetical protein EIZ52_24730 [Pandoraea apista]RSD16633.1 hypothetical protein EJB12_05210 [Pandoraea apista]RSK87518.1 hypothetical protein EJE96_02020 [Pandoraea apista]